MPADAIQQRTGLLRSSGWWNSSRVWTPSRVQAQKVAFVMGGGKQCSVWYSGKASWLIQNPVSCLTSLGTGIPYRNLHIAEW